MDTWGFLILAVGLALYFVKATRHPAWLFVAGIGAGIVVGAVWAMLIVYRVMP